MDKEARLVYSSRVSANVLEVNMIELGPKMGGLSYQSLYRSDLRSGTAQFESKTIAFTKYGNHLVFQDSDNYWKVYLLAGYNQRYVPEFTPKGRMLQTSMTPMENLNNLFQPAHLVTCQSGYGQPDVYVHKMQKTQCEPCAMIHDRARDVHEQAQRGPDGGPRALDWTNDMTYDLFVAMETCPNAGYVMGPLVEGGWTSAHVGIIVAVIVLMTCICVYWAYMSYCHEEEDTMLQDVALRAQQLKQSKKGGQGMVQVRKDVYSGF